MRKIFGLLFLCSSAFAAGPIYTHDPATLNLEIQNIYQNIKSPLIATGTAQGFTINSLVVSTITASTGTFTGLAMKGNISMANNKITGLANGTASTDAVAFGQLFAGFQAPTIVAVNVDSTSTTNVFKPCKLTASITLTNSAHRVLIFANVSVRHNTATDSVTVAMFRDTTNLNDPTNGQGTYTSATASASNVACLIDVDTPGDTNAHSYTVYFKNDQAAGTAHCADSRDSFIVLMEII